MAVVVRQQSRRPSIVQPPSPLHSGRSHLSILRTPSSDHWLEVAVPANVAAGQMLQFFGPDGRPHLAQVPAGFSSGQSFRVQIKGGVVLQPWMMKVPDGARAGASIVFLGLNKERSFVQVPPGLLPGSTFVAMIPAPTLRPSSALDGSLRHLDVQHSSMQDNSVRYLDARQASVQDNSVRYLDVQQSSVQQTMAAASDSQPLSAIEAAASSAASEADQSLSVIKCMDSPPKPLPSSFDPEQQPSAPAADDDLDVTIKQADENLLVEGELDESITGEEPTQLSAAEGPVHVEQEDPDHVDVDQIEETFDTQPEQIALPGESNIDGAHKDAVHRESDIDGVNGHAGQPPAARSPTWLGGCAPWVQMICSPTRQGNTWSKTLPLMS